MKYVGRTPYVISNCKGHPPLRRALPPIALRTVANPIWSMVLTKTRIAKSRALRKKRKGRFSGKTASSDTGAENSAPCHS